MCSCIYRRTSARSLSRRCSGVGSGIGRRAGGRRASARLGLVDRTPRFRHQFWIIQFSLPSFMSFAKGPANRSTDLLMSQGKRSLDVKSSLDVTDDLEHATSLSYTSGMQLNAQSTTSLPPQHGDHPSQTQAGREGNPPQVYFDSQSESQRPQHKSRNSSWDLLGGARKFGQAYEHFDPRNASEQHLVFADGDLPNSKVSYHRFFDAHGSEIRALPLSVCSLLPISFERINRDAMDVVHHPRLGHYLDPWHSRSYGFPEGRGSIAFTGFRVKGLNAYVFTDMGSAFDMVEHLAERRMGWYDHFLFHTAPISCFVNSAGWWASLAGAYVSFRTLRPL